MNQTQRNWPELLLGLGIIAVGVVIAIEAATIRVGPLYAKVGPGAFLWLAAGLLILCGGIVANRSTKAAETNAVVTELRGPATILAGLAASVVLLEPLGFIPTATLIFATTANGLGSAKTVRDLLIGVIISAIAFAVFKWGLGLRLPVGFLFS